MKHISTVIGVINQLLTEGHHFVKFQTDYYVYIYIYIGNHLTTCLVLSTETIFLFVGLP